MFGKKEDKNIVDISQYEKMIEELLKSLGLDPDQCRHKPKTLWSARRGSALIYFEIFPLNNTYYIEISSPVMMLPSKNLLPFYRRLLELNYEIIGPKFFVKNDWVYLAENRELRGLDMEELKRITEAVASFADLHDDTLIEEFKG